MKKTNSEAVARGGREKKDSEAGGGKKKDSEAWAIGGREKIAKLEEEKQKDSETGRGKKNREAEAPGRRIDGARRRRPRQPPARRARPLARQQASRLPQAVP